MPLKAAVVNEAFVRRYLGAGDPIGRRFGWGDPPKVTYSIEIVGVVKDALYGDLRLASRPLVYTPFGLMPVSPHVLVRTSGPPETLIETIRREVAAIDPTIDFRMRPLSAEVDRMLVREMLLSRLSGFFAVLAVLLAGIGVYGVMAYTIGRRTREIAICVALGAARRSILSAELRSALALVAIGIAAGIPAAIAGGRLIASQLFGVSTADPATLAGVAALLALVAAMAAFLPARRAARVDPTIALRWE
jgi:ABC-type antimicrobial peptide transport system permease subunit